MITLHKVLSAKGQKRQLIPLEAEQPITMLEPSSDTKTSNAKLPPNCEEALSIETNSAGQLDGFATGNTC